MRARVVLTLAILGLTMAVVASPVVAGQPVPSADLAITKSDTPDPVSAGGTLSYLVIVENLGPDDATGVSWTDTYPAQLELALTGLPAGWVQSSAGNTVTFTRSGPPVAADEIQQFLLEFTVDPGVPDGTILTNSATVTSSTADPTAGNNGASAQTTVVAPPPTPVASLQDAAMAHSPSNLMIPLGFAVLLVGALGALAVVGGRKSVSRP